MIDSVTFSREWLDAMANDLARLQAILLPLVVSDEPLDQQTKTLLADYTRHYWPAAQEVALKRDRVKTMEIAVQAIENAEPTDDPASSAALLLVRSLRRDPLLSLTLDPIEEDIPGGK